MKLEEQVLNISQVQELQELGFDFKKYASMCWVKLFDRDNFYRILNKEYAEYAELNDYIPTLTIGDIIEVLPERIEEDYYLEMSKNHVDYCDDHVSLNGYIEFKLIDALFEMLKWCIKEKHIEL